MFTATLRPVATVAEAEAALAELVRDKDFRFASHNVVAWRIPVPDGRVAEHKADGYSGRGREAGAGRVVLEVLRARDALGVVVVVTRWFGGVNLGGDRFRHFGRAASMALDEASR